MDSDSNTPWKYKPGDSSAPPDEDAATPSGSSQQLTSNRSAAESVSWTAAEFIDHQQGSSWYALLFLGTAIASVAVYFFTREYFAAGTFVALGIIVAVAAVHKPRNIQYELTAREIRVGEKAYSYRQFKSFSVAHEGVLSSVNLTPLKRFSPPLSLYFEPKDEERIANAMGNQLPFEEHKVDLADRVTRRLKF